MGLGREGTRGRQVCTQVQEVRTKRWSDSSTNTEIFVFLGVYLVLQSPDSARGAGVVVLCVQQTEHNMLALSCPALCGVQIVVMKEKRADGWMFGRSGNEQGLFPSSYVELVKDH